VKFGARAVVGIAISAFLIWWTLKDESLSEIWAVVRTGNLWLLGLAIAVTTGSFLIRAIRWNVLLQPVKPDTKLKSRFGAVTIGFMTNNLIPARAGEFVRAYAFSRMEPIAVSAAFGSVIIERFLDGVVLAVFLIFPVLLPSFPAADNLGAFDALIRAALFGLVAVAGLMLALLVWPGALTRVARRLVSRLPARAAQRVLGALQAFLDSLQVLRSPALMLSAMVWSVALWSWQALAFYLAMAAFGIHAGWAAPFFAQAVVGIVVAVPSAPGFFGTFHFAANWALSTGYGVQPERALAFAYGFHLGGFIPVTIIGLWFANRIGLSLRELGKTDAPPESAAAGPT
jgi:uncharacterized protein (TIRG00374 family)